MHAHYFPEYFFVVVCSIIGQLERLKREAADVQKKVEETDVVMAEVETVSQQYLPLSAACSSMYFTLESLNQVRIYSTLVVLQNEAIMLYIQLLLLLLLLPSVLSFCSFDVCVHVCGERGEGRGTEKA